MRGLLEVIYYMIVVFLCLGVPLTIINAIRLYCKMVKTPKGAVEDMKACAKQNLSGDSWWLNIFRIFR